MTPKGSTQAVGERDGHSMPAAAAHSVSTETDEQARADGTDAAESVGEHDAGWPNEAADSSVESDTFPDLASYRSRVGAFCIDIVTPVTASVLLLAVNYVLDWVLWFEVLSSVLVVLIACVVVWNRVSLQGRTGRTVGKNVLDIAAMDVQKLAPIGRRRAFYRELMHLADTAVVLIGWLRPLWTPQRQTIADRVCGTLVVSQPRSRGRLRSQLVALAALVVMTASAGALFGTTYAVQYTDDMQTAEARDVVAGVAAEGVTDLLSYSPDTAAEKFVAAAGRLTGSFRDYYSQFTQQVVVPAAQEKKVNTQAKVVGTAAEDVGPRSATVLLMVDQSTSTADSPTPNVTQSSIRVRLNKVDDAWLISDFTPVP